VAERFLHWPAEKKILLYHNVTPPELPYLSESARKDLRWGREQLTALVKESDLQIGLSSFSCAELEKLGARALVQLPYFLWRRALTPRAPRRPIVLVVGRVEPHKRVLETLEAFQCLLRQIPEARLVIVGNLKGSPAYIESLRHFIAKNTLTRQVRLTGRISDRRLVTLYERAGVLLTLSDHEGFCVPIAEAMTARLPVVAYAAGAVPETLGQGGILLEERDPERVAAALEAALRDEPTRERIALAQAREAERFRPERFSRGFSEALVRLGLAS
jgi:glycosyltransferase involved in cell wall biosynthesis